MGPRVQLAKWLEAEALSEVLLTHRVVALRVNAAQELGSLARPGGCFLRFRGKGSGEYHYGGYARDAYALGVATSALCRALLTDASIAVHEAAIGALRTLQPAGDEAVKHTLLSVMELHVGDDKKDLRAATVELLTSCWSHRDLELVTRLALTLEAGGCEKEPWIDAKYQELCSMLPPPGRSALPRKLRRMLAHLGVALYTGRTMPVVLPSSAGVAAGRTLDGWHSVCVPSLSDVPAGSLVGSTLLLSVHSSASPYPTPHVPPPVDVLAERVGALELGTPGAGYLGAAVTGLGVVTYARTISRDIVVKMLRLKISCLGRALAKALNPLMAARTYKLSIEGEKVQGPLATLTARGIHAPVFVSEQGADTVLLPFDDFVVANKGMDSSLLIELLVWGGAELGKAQRQPQRDGRPPYYKVAPNDKHAWHPPLALQWRSVGGCVLSVHELMLLSLHGGHEVKIPMMWDARQLWHSHDAVYNVWQRAKERTNRHSILASMELSDGSTRVGAGAHGQDSCCGCGSASGGQSQALDDLLHAANTSTLDQEELAALQDPLAEVEILKSQLAAKLTV